MRRQANRLFDENNPAPLRVNLWIKVSPPAYATGALVANDVMARRGLHAALALSGDDLRTEVDNALASHSRHQGNIDWSRVCSTGKL